jgi:hypothetical protein
MALTGRAQNALDYTCQFQGIANSNLDIQNVQELTWCALALEAYGVTKCSDYPNADFTAFRDISINVSTAPLLTWGPVDSVTDCGQHAVVVSNANPAGEVDLFYRTNALGLIVYGWDGSQMTTQWGTGDIGQGYGALSWLAADVDGDGEAELLQPWKNGSKLGLIVYGWDGSQMTTQWGTADIGQGYGALSWLAADVDGDGKAELLQPWKNGSKLGLIVYGWDGSQMTTQWGTGNIGQGPGALSWLAADVDGDGKAELLQPWKNGSKLGLIVYGWDGSQMKTQWGTADIGQGYGALSWLVADVDNDGKVELLQPWKNVTW